MARPVPVRGGLRVETAHAFVDATGDCWLFQGYIGRWGYGNVHVEGRTKLAHRAFYEMLVGQIPPGLHLDHLCRVRHCVNPDHLEPVTAKENSRRSPLVRPTHCKHGHRLVPANVTESPSRPGRRACRECRLRRVREWRRRKAATDVAVVRRGA